MAGTGEGLEAGDLVLDRTLDVPREAAFAAWIDARRVARWWGPDCFTNPLCELDPRPGGAIRIHMRGPDGMIYPMTGAYREVVPPERIAFTSSALGEDDEPLFETLNIATFAEQGGRTTLTLRARILSAPPAAARHLNGMEQGWNQTLDRFAAYIAGTQNSQGDDR